MKVKFILRGLTDAFFDGNSGSIVGLMNLSDADKFAELKRHATGDLRHAVSMEVGNGQFRDRVELNSLLRLSPSYTFKLEPRKGYRLATFEIR